MTRPCLCERTDLTPWAAYRPGDCRLCWLYHHDADYQARWDERAAEPITLSPRSLPCIHLGEVLDEKGCPCPGLWLRACPLHGPVTVQTCKFCPDYEEDA